MFETLHELDDRQLDAAAKALRDDGSFMSLMDPSGVYMVFTACPGHEVDFTCVVSRGRDWAPAPLTPMQHSVLHAWTSKVVPVICRRWTELEEREA